jgi:2-oxoglutarate dehydrogenase E2 component (dihydrolipoamide succinyltransferase)
MMDGCIRKLPEVTKESGKSTGLPDSRRSPSSHGRHGTQQAQITMSINLTIPDVGESIQEVQIGRWLKQQGDTVEQDEILVELETDKASMELPAPESGRLSEILKQEGETVSIGDVIAHIEKSDGQASKTESKSEFKAKSKSASKTESKSEPQSDDTSHDDTSTEDVASDVASDVAESDVAESKETKSGERADTADTPRREESAHSESDPDDQQATSDGQSGNASQHRPATTPEPADPREQESIPATPAARRALRKHGLTAEEVHPAGQRLRPSDVTRHLQEAAEHEHGAPQASGSRSATDSTGQAESDLEEIVPMSLIRRRIAQRLVEAQQQAALLTTFNEIDLSAVIDLRREYQEPFEQEYGVRLGYMPFFVKAVIDALRHFPGLNAEIRDDGIVYRSYYHVGIAIGGGKGLVVPVLRFAERMSFSEIEATIGDFAQRASSNKLRPDELQGGTFTITNGGVYGSLLSTPIVNPPQSGVLGMHAIQPRPVARDGEVVIRPMMYVALTYDHRIVDGREAVLCLHRIKDAIEEPARMLIEA